MALSWPGFFAAMVLDAQDGFLDILVAGAWLAAVVAMKNGVLAVNNFETPSWRPLASVAAPPVSMTVTGSLWEGG